MRPLVGLVAFALAVPSWLECSAGPESARKTHPLSVSGRALDSDGQPVPGATIFLISTNGISEMLGQTRADEDGRYEFRELPLPIPAPPSRADFEYGSFRVLGRARGNACAWRAIKHLYLDPRFELDPTARDCGYYPGEKIALNLKFAEPYAVSGRVVDESGKPIAGAKVTVNNCSFFDDQGDEPERTPRDFLSLSEGSQFLPQDFVTESDVAGNFVFQSVARERYCLFSVEHPDYTSVRARVAASDNPPKPDPDGRGLPLRPLPMAMTLQWNHAVAVRVSWADTGRAAAGVSVIALHERAVSSAPGNRGVSDQEGNLVLRIPKGKYRIQGNPPLETDYLISEQSIQFDEPPASPIDLRISRGATLILRVVDAKTGKGIPDVSLWCLGQQGGRVDIGSISTPREFRTTNSGGEIRVAVPPGTRRYGVEGIYGTDGFTPDADARFGRELTIAAGETATIEFKGTLRPPVEPREEDTKTVESNEPEAIIGRVIYDGAAPPRKMIAGMIGGGSRGMLRGPPTFDDSILVHAATRGLANVVIYLDRAPTGIAVPAPSQAKVALSVEDGRLEPRISALRSGQTCLITNNSPSPTDVNFTPIRNPGLHQIIAPRRTVTWRSDKPERSPFPIRSSIQFGMKGYQIVTDHPWAAVTDQTGEFVIRGLPPGKYQFKIWHETAGYLEKSLPVEVQAGAPTKLDLTYPPSRFGK